MSKMFFALLLASSFLLAQGSSTMSQDSSKASKGQETIQGCVSRSSGDYILMKQDPAVTYELQATGKIKASPLPGATRGGHGYRVAVDEHQFRHVSKIGLSIPGDAYHHLDQDHREGVFDRTESLSKGERGRVFGPVLVAIRRHGHNRGFGVARRFFLGWF